jgi:hypothetical protein
MPNNKLKKLDDMSASYNSPEIYELFMPFSSGYSIYEGMPLKLEHASFYPLLKKDQPEDDFYGSAIGSLHPNARKRVASLSRSGRIKSLEIYEWSTNAHKFSIRVKIEFLDKDIKKMNFLDAMYLLRQESESANIDHNESENTDDPGNPESFSDFPFELLPIGEWPADKVLEYFNKNKNILNKTYNKIYNPSRLKDLFSLNPEKYWKGKEDSRLIGYICFKFKGTNRVVLECPMEGNATYILWGDWKHMIQLSKGEIKSIYPNNYKVVYHKPGWIGRLKSAIWHS